MNPYVGLVVDVAMLGALGFAIYHGLRISRLFDKMQADRRAFDQFVQSLNVASARAEAAIRSLKEAALENGEALQARIGQARALTEELEIMLQAGDSLANRLSDLATDARKPEAAPPPRLRTQAEQGLKTALDAARAGDGGVG